jgi:hypothetical protein
MTRPWIVQGCAQAAMVTVLYCSPEQVIRLRGLITYAKVAARDPITG